MNATGFSEPRVVLYQRTSPGRIAANRQRVLEGRLERLEESGAVESVETRTWPKVLTEGGSDHESARETLDEITEWASDDGALLSPFFERRAGTQNDLLDIELEPATVLPVTAMLVYDDDELVAAYPHTDDAGPRSVPDAIRSLDALVEGPDAGAETDELAEVAD